MQKRIVVLGSTGSIGAQTLEVCRAKGWRPVALAAGWDWKTLAAQAREFQPERVALADQAAARELRRELADTPVRVEGGPEALCELAALPEADAVVAAIVGVAGLSPVLAAARAGKHIALANKESLVAAGSLVTRTVREHGARILPVDSEHSAIFQCLQAGRREELRAILLTASGGPFFGMSRAQLETVTPRDALRHPNWVMGAKITVDSATLMNKGLELMEAMWLFGVEARDIQVVVHRQSVVHSAVEFADGAVIAQMGVPDMRTAIQYALTWPERLPVEGVRRLGLEDLKTLTFQEPDRESFLCLAACERAADRGGLYPAAANGVNEVAVAAFLEGRIPFPRIGELVARAVEELRLPSEADSLEAVLAADQMGREYAVEFM